MSIKAQAQIRDARQRGLTMIELIIFIVIVSVAVVGVLQVIALNTARSADPIRQKQALAIAEGLMNEIRSAGMSLCDPKDPNYGAVPAVACATTDNVGPEADNVARPFDNVNDYVTAYGTPRVYATDAAGNDFPAGYTASVTITQPNPFNGVAAGATSLISIAVTYGGSSTVLASYRIR